MNGCRTLEGIVSTKEGWTPGLGETLELRVEPTNPHDQFATAVIKPDGAVVGHISKHMPLKLFHSFSRRLGSIGFCEVTGSSVKRGVGLGMEILCKYQSVDVKLT